MKKYESGSNNNLPNMRPSRGPHRNMVTHCLDTSPAQLCTDGGEPEVRAVKISELADQAKTDPAAVTQSIETLTAAVSHTDPEVRQTAVEAILYIARYDPTVAAEAAPALARCLDDEATATQRAALNVVAILAKYTPAAVAPAVSDVFTLLDGTNVSQTRTATQILLNLSLASSQAYVDTLKDQYSTLADADSDDDERVQAAERLAVLGYEDLQAVAPILPELFEQLSAEPAGIPTAIVDVASNVEPDSPYTEPLAEYESELRALLEDGDSHTRVSAYDALSAIGATLDEVDIENERVANRAFDEEPPEPADFRVTGEQLRRCLDRLEEIGGAVSGEPATNEPIAFDLRHRLARDIEFAPTNIVGYTDLISVFQSTEWLNLDASRLYEANQRLVFDELMVGTLGTTPTASTTDLTAGHESDLLVYFPIESDWDRDDTIPSVFIFPDGTAATFDAVTTEAATAVLELVIERIIDGKTDSEMPDLESVSADQIRVADLSVTSE